MSPLALLAVLAAPPAPTCPDTAAATVEIGDPHAPLRLHAFFDPALTTGHAIFNELRRVVAERPDDIAVSLWIVRPQASFDPRLDRVRRFVWAAARLGLLDAALALIARAGPDHVGVALLDDERTRALAPALHTAPERLLAALAEGCDGARLDRASAHAITVGRHAPLGMVRLPVFAVGEFVFDDTPTLERVRPELGREPVRRALRWRAAASPPPAPPPSSGERSRVPPAGGLVLGGIGLPHHLVVLGQGEDDPNLFLSLPRAMQYRSEHPGRLAIHILARGNGFGANLLRGRLCAAKRLGRELGYARLLAGTPEARHDPGAADAELISELDAEADSHCEAPDDAAAEPLPEGAWLDGVPRSPTELEDLPSLLRSGATGRRPLDPLLRPPATD